MENSRPRPRCSPSPSSRSVPAARLGDSPSARLGPARPTSSLPRPAPAPGSRLGGQAAGEPLRLPSVFIPSPQTLWVAVPFPVEQETRLFPRLGAIPLPLWLCPGTKTQQGNAPGARKRRDSAIHPQRLAQGADSCHSAPQPLGKRGPPIQSEPQRKRIDGRLFIYLCKSEPTLFAR